MKYKIAVCDHIHDDGIAILSACNEVELIDISSLSFEEKLEKITNMQGIITRSSTPVNKTLLGHATALKSIVRAGVGVDNVDIDACSRRGIVVMNVPTSNTLAAVELTMTHMLSCVRNFVNCNVELKSGSWNRENWYGTELYEKKLGVIGFGNIGSRVAVRAKAFGMNIVAYDPYIPSSKVTSLDMIYTDNFEDILQCDIITIHTPKNTETTNMIAKSELAKLKENAILINCARGGLVNELDLLEVLRTKKIRMAGIDVFDKEPANKHPFLALDNTTTTPHIGANTLESQRRVAISAAGQIINAVKGIAYKDALNLPISDIPKEMQAYFDLSQKMGFFASFLTKNQPKIIRLEAAGKIKEHAEALLTFGAVGALRNMIDNVNHVNAQYVAKEKDITLECTTKEQEGTFLNKLTLELICENRTVKISGTIFDDDIERIISIDDFEVDVNPKGNMILFKNTDIAGVVGQLGNILAKYDVNIADMRLGRNKDKQALAVMTVDEKVSSEILHELKLIPACLALGYVELQ